MCKEELNLMLKVSDIVGVVGPICLDNQYLTVLTLIVQKKAGALTG